MSNPSEAHIRAFGLLIYHYASVETGLKIAICGMLKTNLADVLILSQPYGSLDLRRVTKSIAKERTWKDPKHLDQIICIIGEMKPISGLRNYIAHSRWTDGSRPGSIKPRHVDIRNEKAEFHGDIDTEADWTASEIENQAQTLIKLNVRLINWLQETGLRAIIDKNIASASAEIAE